MRPDRPFPRSSPRSNSADDTHAIARRKAEKMESLRKAFGISREHAEEREGDAFDQDLQAKIRDRKREDREEEMRAREERRVKDQRKRDKDRKRAEKERKEAEKTRKKEEKRALKERARMEKAGIKLSLIHI